MKSSNNTETNGNTLSHLKQRRIHFVFEDTFLADQTTQNTAWVLAESSRFVAYVNTASGDTTLPVNNSSFTSNLKIAAAPRSASQQFSSCPCGIPSTDSS